MEMIDIEVRHVGLRDARAHFVEHQHVIQASLTALSSHNACVQHGTN